MASLPRPKWSAVLVLATAAVAMMATAAGASGVGGAATAKAKRPTLVTSSVGRRQGASSAFSTRRSNSLNGGSRVKRDSQQYLNAAYEVDDRLSSVLSQLRSSIPSAVDSVESDIALANRNRGTIGLANFLGMLFGLAAAVEGDVSNIGALEQATRLQVIAELLYGYGYWGPFLLQFEDARLDCNVYDLDEVLSEYSFLTDMDGNYGYLSNAVSGGGGYSGAHPREQLTDITDPIVLQYYAVELNHAMKRALYCIVSRKGGNQSALEINTLIDLYTQLLSERLAMTNQAINEYPGHHKTV